MFVICKHRGRSSSLVLACQLHQDACGQRHLPALLANYWLSPEYQLIYRLMPPVSADSIKCTCVDQGWVGTGYVIWTASTGEWPFKYLVWGARPRLSALGSLFLTSFGSGFSDNKAFFVSRFYLSALPSFISSCLVLEVLLLTPHLRTMQIGTMGMD